MRDRVKRIFSDFQKGLVNLRSAIEHAEDDLDIDGTIKRFELCYELSWKLIKAYLEDKGIICRNPRDCFKEAFINGLIGDEDGWIKMIEDRNYLVHTYTFEESRKIFEHIKETHIFLFEEFFKRIEQDFRNE